MLTHSELKIFKQNVIFLVEKNYQVTYAAAKAIGCDRGDFSKLLYREKNFRLETLIKIAKTFNVSVFLLFSRLFDDPQYRDSFPFVDADYMSIIRTNFHAQSIPQSHIALDSTTVSHIMNGRRSNVTIRTICKIAAGASMSISELLKTEEDKIREKQLKEEEI